MYSCSAGSDVVLEADFNHGRIWFLLLLTIRWL